MGGKSVKPVEAGTRQRHIWISLSLLVALGVIAYFNSFHVPFVFDDEDSITGNFVVHDLGNFLSNGTGYSYNPRRFIGYLTFALNYKWGGLDVTSYHIVNLSIHLINALLVYGLMMLTFKTPLLKGSALAPRSGTIAFFAAALFTVHPIQTEAVTYIVQRLASLAALFYIASLCSYIGFRLIQQSGNKPGWKGYALYAVSIVSAVLAMKTKEIAFTLPVMLVIYEWLFFGRDDLKRRLLWALPLLATAAIIPLSMLDVGKPLGEVLSDVSQVTVVQSSQSRWEYLMTEFRVIVTYIRLLFLPVGQNLDYDYPRYQSLFEPQVALSFLGLVGLFVLAIVLIRKAGRGADASLRVISFGIIWFFVTLSVESSIIPITDVIFEHRLYLPSIGFFMAVVTIFFLLTRGKTIKGVPAAAIALTAAVLILTGTTIARNMVWQSTISIWKDVVAKSPMNARGYNSLGAEYAKLQLYDQAKEEILTAVRLQPDYTDAHTNLGVVYQALNMLNEAAAESRFVIGRDPNNAKAHFNLGVVYLKIGRFDLARKELQAGLAIKPEEENARRLLGMMPQ